MFSLEERIAIAPWKLSGEACEEVRQQPPTKANFRQLANEFRRTGKELERREIFSNPCTRGTPSALGEYLLASGIEPRSSGLEFDALTTANSLVPRVWLNNWWYSVIQQRNFKFHIPAIKSLASSVKSVPVLSLHPNGVFLCVASPSDSQMNSLAASVKLTYSASMVDRLTDFCLKIRDEIGVSSIKVMNPPIDTRSSLFVAKSESE
ncbi:hypothetical protein TNCV_454481 [Trichonephila clavipes]|nr:hypothetical protein TNCV_454481 [Trichonephila clavipes]